MGVASCSTTVAVGQPSTNHPFDQELSTEDGETSTRTCHESLRPVWVPKHLTPCRGLLFVNDVFGHHR